MDWDNLKQQLQDVWSPAVVRLVKMPAGDWKSLISDPIHTSGGGQSIVANQETLFFLSQEGQTVQLLSVGKTDLTKAELALVELLSEGHTAALRKQPPYMASEEERKVGAIRDWLRQQLDSGASSAEMPDNLVSALSLYSAKIPILLYGDYPSTKKGSYQELKKLLESFFDADIVLIPLMEKEWLILGSDKLLSADAGDDREYGEEESLEETLTAIALGLREMLANEWLGECQVAVHYPMTPAKSLYVTVVELREALMLGRTYHVGSNIHLPWQLHLEKLIQPIPEENKADFLERVLKRIDVVMDAETLMTLEQFFSLDCNVSETAKKLYIHRNTLLYRLDKFKQETGLDVRTFNDAVLVKIALLLYKVTKRK
ncbi:PucR family transcriptional regulator [Paenibacillus hamazuiensis]|uniref:PucR family transcriptional regulator n=1 Tax=Paenibacillus hamazuiensis TaxID=2936508 RepID=UPI00200D8021|nr:helix-turn-helix domain-containing protein [Paenibacillus hamazuiensis]